MREKERRGNATILLPHLCFRVAPCSSYRESPILSLSYTSGNFHYRTWLVYSNDGLPQNAPGLREQASWMHTHLVSFVELSYIYSSSASVHANPYSSHWHQLMDISIARWLAASMWDFLPFCLLRTTSTIIFYSTHSAISMAHAHVLREGL